MAFDPKQLWRLSILETAGIATVITSDLLIAGIASFHLVMAERFKLAQTAWRQSYIADRGFC